MLKVVIKMASQWKIPAVQKKKKAARATKTDQPQVALIPETDDSWLIMNLLVKCMSLDTPDLFRLWKRRYLVTKMHLAKVDDVF